MKIKTIITTYIPLAVLIVICSIWYFDAYYCEINAPLLSRFRSSPILDKDKFSAGYTLFTNLGVPKEESEANNKVYLVNSYGKLVHSWRVENRPFYSQMKKNGNLLVAQMTLDRITFKWVANPIIQEIDWQGNVVWEYKNDLMHHDFELLPDGRLAVLVYDKVPEDVALKVQGGIAREVDKGEVYADSILEVDRDGKTVWEWDLYKHLDPEKDILGEADLLSDWTHANSLRFMESNPINGEPAYLISIRNLSFVAMVSRITGEIIWRSPDGMFDHQHDATLLENGNILVFDNGFDIHSKKDSILKTRVVEVNPKTGEIQWEFEGGEVLEKFHFFNAVLGGAQKLNNGNVLITMGIDGELIEVTPDKKIVWNYINPYLLGAPDGGFPINYIFKARRVYENEIDWPVEIEESYPVSPSYCKESLMGLGRVLQGKDY